MAKPRLCIRNKVYYVLWQEGKRTRWKSLKTKDRSEAGQKFTDFKKELNTGKITPITDGIRQGFKEFIDEFLEHIETRVEGSTYTLYSVALQKALDCWGDILLPHITSRHLDRLITDMSRSGLKKPTINKNYRHIKHAIKQAQKWGYIKTLIDFPKQLREKKSRKAFTTKEIQKLFDILDKHKDQELADLIKLALYTGLRNGELLRLRIGDIDNPQEGSLRISCEQKNGEESDIPINNKAREILDRCVVRAKEHKSQKIFCRWNTVSHISHLFKALVRSAGMDIHKFHDTRHTFCTTSVISGNNDYITQRLARHKSLQTTKGYVDLVNDVLRDASNKLDFKESKIRRVK